LMLLLLLGAGIAFFLSRRDKGTDSTAATASATSTRSPGVTPLLRLAGSNTIGAALGPALAEAWLIGRGATNVHSERGANAEEMRVTGTSGGQPVAIELNAHGTATAFSGLTAGSADIGMASRKINPAEAAELQSKGLGDLTTNASERVLGLDGV